VLGTGASVVRSEAGSTCANGESVSDRGVGTDRLSNKKESSSKEFRVKKEESEICTWFVEVPQLKAMLV